MLGLCKHQFLGEAPSRISVSPNPIPKPETVVSYPQEHLDVCVQFGEPKLVGIGLHDSF